MPGGVTWEQTSPSLAPWGGRSEASGSAVRMAAAWKREWCDWSPVPSPEGEEEEERPAFAVAGQD